MSTQMDCGCPQVSSKRLVEGHFSVHFGDRLESVTVDGKDVTGNAYECMAGRQGWVCVFRKSLGGRRTACPPALMHAKAKIIYGHVVVNA